MNIKIIITVFFIVAISKIDLHAQSPPINFTGWYGYEGFHQFQEGKPWGLFGEAIIKRQDVILEEAQYFLRVGINYTLKSGNRITGGLAWQGNTPYDEVSLPYNWPDYRIWEQYMIRKPKPKGMWVHLKSGSSDRGNYSPFFLRRFRIYPQCAKEWQRQDKCTGVI